MTIADCRLTIDGLMIDGWRVDWRLAIALSTADCQSAIRHPSSVNPIANRQSTRQPSIINP